MYILLWLGFITNKTFVTIFKVDFFLSTPFYGYFKLFSVFKLARSTIEQSSASALKLQKLTPDKGTYVKSTRQGPLKMRTEHFTQFHFMKSTTIVGLVRTQGALFGWICWTMTFCNVKKFTSRRWSFSPLVFKIQA